MKVLLRIRSDVERFPGGDYTQLLKTRTALGRLGVESTVAPGVGEIAEPCDVVHLFNTTRIHETAVQCDQAIRRGLPVVISPIWHSWAEMKRCYRQIYGVPFFPLTGYMAAKEAWYARRSGLPQYPAAVFNFRGVQRRVLKAARVLLPNSQVEADTLRQETGVTAEKVCVIPFGFDPPAVAKLPWDERRDIVCAGRIEPRKNQLGVIQAFKTLPKTGDKLILYGAWNESHPGYCQKVRAEMQDGWVEYGGQVAQEPLYAAMGRAKLVILASFFETFGLVALEGIACGAAVSVSDSPYARGFFADYVGYCDPFSVDSIAAAITAALRAPPPDYKVLLARFSWDDAAAKTLEAYKYATAH
jgi:glycosyltransferase involved in cell wall biosynthesis